MPKKVSIGIVTSDSNSKTRRVEIPRLVRHPKYGKYIRKKTVCYVHDENDESHLGDTVEIIEGRRRSKTKRWELVRILEKNTAVDLAAMQTQSALLAEELQEQEENAEATSEVVTEGEATVEADGNTETEGAGADGDQESE
ncbi:MAG TPA: 30S ribosomal protein S17 [Planctomycetes bacterium]|nr:30S ribosomal protein S17 [Planctomycetaceae bacterium]HIN94904.1 30S ribosomal protein S17 [Planctomycetota bacterium]